MPIFELDPNTWKALNELLDEALDLPPEERQAWVDNLPSEHDELKPRLLGLLANAEEDSANRVLDKLPTIDPQDDSPSTNETAGQTGDEVGPYRLERLLGKGGMSEVWLANRVDGIVERSVALKLPRGTWQGAELRERMARERQILATLNEPHIAKLLDAGFTTDGQPYLALEFVEGRPVGDYARERNLDIRSRLNLLLQVTEAVAHAHAHLVVHRDLKPSNILVTEGGQARLLDFGIAKLLDEGLAAKETELTQMAGRRLTLAYASPEQIRGESIGVASDVYSLGVVAYELLTGSRPYRPERESRGALEDAILLTDPETPSEVAQPTAIRKTLRGDLDTILLKALKKDPRERYANVSAFADDIRRYLQGHPVLARPDTTAYRVRKFVARHRAGVLVASVGLVVLSGFAITASLQASRIAAERDRAAVQEANAQRMVDLVVSLFETTDPTAGRGGDTIEVDEFLKSAESKIEDLGSQPELQARMEHMLGRIYLARARYPEARTLFEHADELYRDVSEPDAIFAIDLEIDLARALERTSDLSGSEQRLRDILPRLRSVRGEDHPLVTQTLVRLGRLVAGEEGEGLAREALEIERGREAENWTELARALAGVAEHRSRAGDRSAAEEFYREASEIFVREYGEEHPYAQITLANLATVLTDIDEQVSLYRRLLATAERVFGERSAPVGNRLNNLGVLLFRNGRFEEAEEILTNAFHIWNETGGPDHWRTALAQNNLARVYELQSRHDEAIQLSDGALRAARRSSGSDPRVLGAVLTRRASLLRASSRLDEAEASAREAVELLESSGGRAPDLADARFMLGQVLLRRGKMPEGERLLRESLVQRERLYGQEDPRVGQSRCALGLALVETGREQEAKTLLQQGYQAVRDWPLAGAAEVRACRSAQSDGAS